MKLFLARTICIGILSAMASLAYSSDGASSPERDDHATKNARDIHVLALPTDAEQAKKAEQQRLLERQRDLQRQRDIFKAPSAEFQVMSDAAECAVRLIEKRYTLGSVVLGSIFLDEILSSAKERNYFELDSILERCQGAAKQVVSSSARFNAMEVSTRLQQELPEVPHKPLLISYIYSRMDKSAYCIKTNFSFKAAAYFGIQFGFGEAKCETPFGRRFMLRGPFLGLSGVALGAGFFVEKRPVTVNTRASYRFTETEEYSFVGGVGVGWFENKAYLSKEPEGTKDHKRGLAYGVGVFVGQEVNFNLTKQTRIKPNFVPLFEHFGITIPLKYNEKFTDSL